LTGAADDRATLETVSLSAAYRAPTGEVVEALSEISERFEPGSLAVILGPSGSGKSTLLHCLAGIMAPAGGQVRFGGTIVSGLAEAARDAWRLGHCGLVFQDFRLLDELDALGNVLLPARFARLRLPSALRERAMRLLDGFGVPRRSGTAAGLSRGERQRVALARALLLDPPIILADEPTASLDRANADTIAAELHRLARTGKIVICATHDERLAERAEHTIVLEAGRVTEKAGAIRPLARAGP
jgi:putative ABC transport system ATP-binding protein